MTNLAESSNYNYCECLIRFENLGLIDFENYEDGDERWSTALYSYTQAWGCLTQAEYCVLGFILNRTLRFKKDSERIPQRHFLEGVYRRDGGALVQAPCAVRSHTTIEKAILGLTRKGLITVEPNQRLGNLYTVESVILRMGCLEVRTRRMPEKTEQEEPLIRTAYMYDKTI